MVYCQLSTLLTLYVLSLKRLGERRLSIIRLRLGNSLDRFSRLDGFIRANRRSISNGFGVSAFSGSSIFAFIAGFFFRRYCFDVVVIVVHAVFRAFNGRAFIARFHSYSIFGGDAVDFAGGIGACFYAIFGSDAVDLASGIGACFYAVFGSDAVEFAAGLEAFDSGAGAGISGAIT